MTTRLRSLLGPGALLVLCALAPLAGQRETLVVMTYNLLNFPDNVASRLDAFTAVLATTEPDILVTNEMKSQSGVNTLGDEVLRRISGDYQAAPFTAGDLINNAVFYKSSRVTLESIITIATALRDINGYVFRINDHRDSAFRWTIFAAHLKAGNGAFPNNADAPLRRWGEAKRLQAFIAGQDSAYTYLLAGDLNLYHANEPAFLLLMDSMAVDLEDPMNSRVTWHNNSGVAALHTQSTRTSDLGDGGSTGGMDDRFDFFLLAHHMFGDSATLAYIPGSQVAYGNDGQHYNRSINAAPTNSAVGQDMADALHGASDHLPVLLSLSYPVSALFSEVNGVGVPGSFALAQNHPNPFNPVTTLEVTLSRRATVVLSVYNLRGREVARLLEGFRSPGIHEVVWDGRDHQGRELPTGIYIARLSTSPPSATPTPDNIRSIKMLLLR